MRADLARRNFFWPWKPAREKGRRGLSGGPSSSSFRRRRSVPARTLAALRWRWAVGEADDVVRRLRLRHPRGRSRREAREHGRRLARGLLAGRLGRPRACAWAPLPGARRPAPRAPSRPAPCAPSDPRLAEKPHLIPRRRSNDAAPSHWLRARVRTTARTALGLGAPNAGRCLHGSPSIREGCRASLAEAILEGGPAHVERRVEPGAAKRIGNKDLIANLPIDGAGTVPAVISRFPVSTTRNGKIRPLSFLAFPVFPVFPLQTIELAICRFVRLGPCLANDTGIEHPLLAPGKREMRENSFLSICCADLGNGKFPVLTGKLGSVARCRRYFRWSDRMPKSRI
jgi:hypothetical protein